MSTQYTPPSLNQIQAAQRKWDKAHPSSPVSFEEFLTAYRAGWDYAKTNPFETSNQEWRSELAEVALGFFKNLEQSLSQEVWTDVFILGAQGASTG